MTITVVETNATAVGIADIRPLGVRAPLAVRSRRAPLTRSHPAGPVQPRRSRLGSARTRTPLVQELAGETVLVRVVRPPRHGGGGGPRARPTSASV